MPHSIFGPNQWGVNQVVQTAGTSAANIRNLIDTGFQWTQEVPKITQNIPQGSNQLMIPGSTASTIPWADIIRDSIGKLIGTRDDQITFPRPGGIQANGGPIKDRPFVPEFIDVMLSGALPRGATAYITLADGTVGCQSGYHPEKQGKGYCVRNRRMNALNPRALSRASRRVGGFARAVKRARTLKRICKTL